MTSQKQYCLEMLQDSKSWIPAYDFVGEKLHRGEFIFLSYKSPSRLSDLFKEGKVERRLIRGRSGTQYYSYKIL